MSIYFISILVVVVSSILITFFVLSDNKRTRASNAFAGMSAATTFWAVSSYMVDAGKTYNTSLIAARLAYFFGFLATFFIWYFSINFPKKLEISTKEKWGVALVGIFSLLVSGTSLVILEVEPNPGRATTLIPGVFYNVLLVIFTGFFVLAMSHIIKAKKHAGEQEKRQIIHTLYGVGIGFTWVILTGVLLPVLLDNWQVSLLAPTGVVFLTSFVAYAMLKHQLFDIRAAFARASAYVLVLAFTIVIYAVVVFGLFENVLLVDFENQTIVRAIYISFAIITALIFQNTKSYFDRITSKIFYRDSYDPQQVFDELSNLVVTTYQIEQLAEKSAQIIEKHLKVQFCTYYIESASRQHLFGTRRDGLLIHSDTLFAALTDEKAIIVPSRSTRKTDKTKPLPKLVYDAEIGLIAKVSTNTQYIGIMMLGEKKSGSKFSKTDLKVIDIIVDQLALAFENAVRFEQISMFNLTLQQKINEATQELRSSNTKLQELDEAKDEFISMASHQLRTPLTSVKGYVSMVLEGDAGEINDQQKQLLNQAFFSSQRMVYLISDLLNVSRLKTGKFVIESTEMYMPDVIEEEMQQLIETAKARKLELSYEKPENFPVVMLDETKTRQIIMNFIDNAIYYTPSGGKIEIILNATEHSIDFRVIDNGLGVPKKDQQHLFTKFFRASNAKKARPDGTGLGLFMAKKVVVAQGGSIIFKSQEGKGSTFGFSFQLDKIKKKQEAEKDTENS